MLVFLSACGREESSQIGIRNYTLPDKDKFEESYTSDKKEVAPPSQEIHQTYRWNPHGVFTYVLGGGYSWSTALFKISSVDYDKHCAVVTYTVKDDNGYQLAKIEGKKPKEEDYFFEDLMKRKMKTAHGISSSTCPMSTIWNLSGKKNWKPRNTAIPA